MIRIEVFKQDGLIPRKHFPRILKQGRNGYPFRVCKSKVIGRFDIDGMCRLTERSQRLSAVTIADNR